MGGSWYTSEWSFGLTIPKEVENQGWWIGGNQKQMTIVAILRMAYHVGADVDAEDGDGAERQRYAGRDEDEEGHQLGDVGRQRVRDRLLQVVEDEPALLDAGDDRREVVVEEDHVGRLFRDVRAGDAHGHTWKLRRQHHVDSIQFYVVQKQRRFYLVVPRRPSFLLRFYLVLPSFT